MKDNRLTIHITKRELEIVETLIEKYYKETGITLSKSNFCRSILLRHIKDEKTF